MTDFLKQAEAAAIEVDGVALHQCLQQLFNSDDWAAMSAEQQAASLEQILLLTLDVLAAGDFQDRWQVAKVFPQLGKSVVAPLIEILQDLAADWELRWFVARILGDIHAPEVVMALVNLLQATEDEELRAAAAAALASQGSSAIQVLDTLLQSETKATRVLAVQALSQIRRPQTIASLLRAVDDPEAAVRAMAVEALSSFHDQRVPPVLVKALADPAARVRQMAVIGLGLRSDLLQELSLVNLLAPLLWDLNLDVCQQAAIALGRLGTPAAADVLFRALELPQGGQPSRLLTPIPLQVAIVRALGWQPTPESLGYLQQALSFTPPPVRLEVVRVMGRLSSPDLLSSAAASLQSLLPVLPADPELKQAIALSLGELADLQSIPALIQLLADPDLGVRLHAIAALKKLDAETALAQLQVLSQQDDLSPELRQGIAVALREWQH